MARFAVTPVDAPLDHPLAVRLADLPALREVVVQSAMRDGFGRPLGAEATFTTNEEGELDLTTTAPDSGGYNGVDPMGLVWSMTPRPSEEPWRKSSTVLPPVTITFTALLDGEPVAETIIKRRRLPKGVARRVVRDNGLIGTLFHTDDGRAHPGVLLLGGSEGGLHEADAALLAAHGFTVLALAYFGLRGVPQWLVDIPVEYFGAALGFLRAQDSVSHARLGVVGGLRGGEAALLIGSAFPDVRAVVSIVGSGVLTQGIGEGANLLGILGNTVPAWTAEGDPLPFVPNDITDDLVTQVESGGPVRMSSAFPKDHPPETEIPVERIRGGVLLISAGDDGIWPSTKYSAIAADRLATQDHVFPFEHVDYPDAGHLIAAPPFGPSGENTIPGPGVALDTGGTPGSNAAARADAWPRVVEFLTTNLKP
ncbi:acyl-CoA thioesterase/bile acid-CoA:amino acid N-acyltransferase family protein [Actinokineospora sp. NBRC 105648]|uniref:acyl-CoA thioesterase/bile acid-CoA:amino acid N-acyltransferase family protein n=1 Tax=Actinokineospora sp. NBRC 105648 TaxID=3032206 RepID=UPI0024A1888C|nr:acyl-CoA thioesterase/bile acid-CoA:amino acid N-acyltransferase family protein [Actinokineospora sp. NBRC 105648]GLZ43403.1 palmitoyl-CoA hydrolase [Actinokineospora sp. NBRC 105648]